MLEDIVQEEEAIAQERDAEAARLGATILQQPIRRLATLQEPVQVSAADSVRTAIDGMNAKSAGCVLVVEQGRLVGIFTERDVLTKIVGAPVDVDGTTVATVMTRDPEVLGPDDRVSYALNKMSVGGFRHIPLVDDAGQPVGVVSMRNVVDYMVEVFRTEVLNLPPLPRHYAHAREGA